LVRIAHHGQLRRPRGEGAQEAVLEGIDVLILVDRDPRVARRPRRGEVRPPPLEKRDRARHQVVEIDNTVRGEERLVGAIGLGQLTVRRGPGPTPLVQGDRREPARRPPLGDP